MGRKRKNDGLDVLSWMITIIITLTVGLVVGIFKMIGSLFNLLFGNDKKGSKKVKSNNLKNTKENVISKSKVEAVLKLKELKQYIDKGPVTIYEEQIVKVPSIIIESPYDKLFKTQIKNRGVEYFLEGNIIHYKFDGQLCIGEVIGTDTYQTSIIFYKNKNIKKVNCSCPYFKKDNNYCKHVYALILEYCKKENIDGFINLETYKEVKRMKPKVNPNYYNRMLDACNFMKDIIKNTEEFYASCEVKDDIDIQDMYNEILRYKEKINYYENVKISELSEEIIDAAKEDLGELESLYENLGFEYESVIKKRDEEDELEQEESFEESSEYFMLNNNQKESEDEIDELRKTWGLFDNEIDEVQNGNYDPWQFEEEELEEDDYYSEDED